MYSELATILDNLVCKNTKTVKPLTDLQQAIIQGTLDDLTYKEIQENYTIAQHYELGTISNEASNLWGLLTEALQNAGIIDSDKKVYKHNLLDCVRRVREHIVQSDSGLGIGPSESSDLVGKKLRMRYQITEHLGSTEFSDTYLAEDEDLPDIAEDRDESDRAVCAVKRFKIQPSETTKLFDRKARVLRKLGQHDRIPQLLASFQEDGYFYLITEFIEGQPLSQELIEGTPWEEERVTALMQNILEILSFVHQHYIIHCNIHPDNLILRASDGKIVLTDLGAVTEIDLSENGTDKMRSQGEIHTEYRPPEQTHGSPNLSSDIYTVGLVGIQALTGLSPKKFKKHPDTGDFIWCEKVQISLQFVCCLDNMVRFYFPLRYPSAIEALQAIKNLDSR